MDDMTPVQRHRNMQRIRSKDTAIEVVLRKALWHSGIRYRKNCKDLIGKPDIVIKKYRIAIFCDGEFFHGKNWNVLSQHLKNSNHSSYWLEKIRRNIKRDQEVTHTLEMDGWHVIRFWGQEIKKNPDACVSEIKDLIHELKHID